MRCAARFWAARRGWVTLEEAEGAVEVDAEVVEEDEAMASGTDEDKREVSSSFLPARPATRFLTPVNIDDVVGVLSRLGIAEAVVDEVSGAMLAISELEATLETEADFMMRVVRDGLGLSSRVLVEAWGSVVGKGVGDETEPCVVVVLVVVGTETMDMDVFLLPAFPRLAVVVADDEKDITVVGGVVLLTGGVLVVVGMSLGRARGVVGIVVEGDSAEGAYGV